MDYILREFDSCRDVDAVVECYSDGFGRVAAWPHHAYDYSLPGLEVTAYIYSLDLTPETRD
ncbi:MAG: hypothetical protein KKE36_10905 [Actinobacteria bacterium]|nr:hypothetical protein [Actinomycetota bacterium]